MPMRTETSAPQWVLEDGTAQDCFRAFPGPTRAGASSSLSEDSSLFSESFSSAPRVGPFWAWAAVVTAFPTAGTDTGLLAETALFWGALTGDFP